MSSIVINNATGISTVHINAAAFEMDMASVNSRTGVNRARTV
jgi:hypothetical protein